MIRTMGSLFAGIGGFDLGFERAGFEIAWQVEIDPYCRKVLERHFPYAQRFSDVRECGAHNLKPVDVLCGGFPCQDISNAGKRGGIEGERSGLWSEYARIIGELRPRFVVVENVAALLGRGMGRVLGDLAEIGYDADWEIVSAADVGAPHLRERVWILAYPMQRNGSSEMGHAIEPGLEGFAGNGESRSGWTQANRSISAPRVLGREPFEGRWDVEPNVGRVAHGVPARVDRLKALGNAVVPQIPELIARRILETL